VAQSAVDVYPLITLGEIVTVISGAIFVKLLVTLKLIVTPTFPAWILQLFNGKFGCRRNKFRFLKGEYLLL
jgi:hypothetical protein